jgi:hypothetical protein
MHTVPPVAVPPPSTRVDSVRDDGGTLDAAARALARELGRQAAREWFAAYAMTPHETSLS